MAEQAMIGARTERQEADLRRQLGFELLSIFKGATCESVDEAVERIISVCRATLTKGDTDHDDR